MHILLWQFTANPHRLPDFLAAYNPTGAWAQLFALAEGYLGTELLAATDHLHRFLTLDRWSTPAHYQAFRTRFAQQYAALDAQCEHLTADEISLGAFTTPV